MLPIAALAVAATFAGSCVNPPPQQYQWLSGTFAVKPVLAESQAKIMASLSGHAFEEIAFPEAQGLTGTELPASMHYYIAKAAYVGAHRGTGEPPRGTSLSFSVDSREIGYVTSYRLTWESGHSEFAAVLASPYPLKAVVALCGAAE